MRRALGRPRGGHRARCSGYRRCCKRSAAWREEEGSMLASFFNGLVRASRQWRMILLLLAANILVSIPVVVPLFLLIAQTSNDRPAADAMLADKLDLNWMTDLINERFPGESLTSLGGQMGVLLLVMGFSYLLL